MHPAGFCIFAAPDDEKGLPEARQYIAERGLTSETVKVVRRNRQILVLVRGKKEPYT